MDVQDRLLKEDPTYQQRMNEIEDFTEQFTAYQETHGNVRTVYNIPVVVHVVYRTTSENVSDAQIQSQIDVLNDDFRKLNSDVSNTPSAFASLAADAEINFCLAQTDPSGAATTGINRKYVNKTSWGTNDNVKKSSAGGVNPWDATKYLNIWVCNIGGGILGYAQFPGGSTATDGVVIDYRYFGTIGTTTAPYNLGRTATHEVGHYFNLRHIWGDASCGNDLVSDTPTQQTSNYSCPSYPHVTCSNGPYGDMFMNYMDYVDDACMYMFSNGQKTRMQAVLAPGGARASLSSSTACNSSGGGGGGTSCGTPGSLSSSALTSSSATVSWAAVSGASSYTLQYKTSSSSTWTTVSGITTTSKSLSGLAASTTYNFQVMAVCSGTSGSYSAAASFTTTAASGGGTGTCSDNYENNNTRSKAKTIAVNTEITAKISTSTDVDYFKFSNTSSAKNIYVELYNLPFDYDLQLLKSNGSVLATSQNSGTTAEGIIYNNAPVATYYVKVYGYGGAYSNSSCYNLRANTSSSAYRGTENVATALDEADQAILEKAVIYPNPTQGALSVEFNTFESKETNIKIIDLTGKELMNMPMNLEKGNHTIELDLSSLANGVYFINIQQNGSVQTEKLVITR